eukprot:m.240851 g.240851  ORF g.240851 m.240851 type:complete len:93 (+) comp40197_c1_seq18:1649-1927(+)
MQFLIMWAVLLEAITQPPANTIKLSSGFYSMTQVFRKFQSLQCKAHSVMSYFMNNVNIRNSNFENQLTCKVEMCQCRVFLQLIILLISRLIY